MKKPAQIDPKLKKAYQRVRNRFTEALDAKILEFLADPQLMSKIDQEIKEAGIEDTGEALKKYLEKAYINAVKESKPFKLKVNPKRN